jgi:hypothetical protein
MAEMPELMAQVTDSAAELDRRAHNYRRVEKYKGACEIPLAIRRARVVNAYRMLMEFAQTNYGRLIIRAATSRMEVGGIRSGVKGGLSDSADDAIWKLWQDNRMDSESRLGHDCALTHGRVFAIIWPDDDDQPRITLEDPATVIVEYEEGSRFERVSALRRWVGKDKVPCANLYRPDGIYKFEGPKNTSGMAGTQWTPRQEGGETWPLANPEGVVPVVEIATNRELRATRYGHASGDYEHAIGLLDRINVLEFLRLVIAFTSGFPIRALIGDKILRDDDGNAKPPFELAADVIAQFENPQAKLQELAAGDLKGFGDAIDHDIEALAGICQTPAYYLRSVPTHNVSTDAIRAQDASLNGRVEDHKPNIGEGWEETLRVAGLQAGIDVPSTAEIVWINRESRSLSERADAATKLATVMPWQAVAELTLDATQEQINRWSEMRAADQLIASPPPPPGLGRPLD